MNHSETMYSIIIHTSYNIVRSQTISMSKLPISHFTLLKPCSAVTRSDVAHSTAPRGFGLPLLMLLILKVYRYTRPHHLRGAWRYGAARHICSTAHRNAVSATPRRYGVFGVQQGSTIILTRRDASCKTYPSCDTVKKPLI